jgi:hypothetical protein
MLSSSMPLRSLFISSVHIYFMVKWATFAVALAAYQSITTTGSPFRCKIPYLAHLGANRTFKATGSCILGQSGGPWNRCCFRRACAPRTNPVIRSCFPATGMCPVNGLTECCTYLVRKMPGDLHLPDSKTISTKDCPHEEQKVLFGRSYASKKLYRKLWRNAEWLVVTVGILLGTPSLRLI